MDDLTPRYAGVELGGSKTIAVLSAGDKIVDQICVPTTTPDDTLSAVHRQLLAWQADRRFDGLGIATFGPVRLDPLAEDYGSILTTPKPGWNGTPVLAFLGRGLECPQSVDTDVNAAALAEYRWGGGQGCSSLVYLTIGTGLGGGLLIDGRPVHGRLHPEIGHILTRRAPGDQFGGACPFHGDCIEGLISGPAIERRLGFPAAAAAADHPAWEFVAHDLAQLLATLIHGMAPQRILVGGGVGLGASGLLAAATLFLPKILGGYYADLDLGHLSTMVTAAGLGPRAGPLGAIALAQVSADSSRSGFVSAKFRGR